MGFRLSCDCASGPYMDDRPDETIIMTRLMRMLENRGEVVFISTLLVKQTPKFRS